jgi:hypothetical protein
MGLPVKGCLGGLLVSMLFIQQFSGAVAEEFVQADLELNGVVDVLEVCVSLGLVDGEGWFGLGVFGCLAKVVN